MALIICGDCQKEYSDYASICPKCARPTNLQKNVRNRFPKYWRSKNKLIFEIDEKYQFKKKSEVTDQHNLKVSNYSKSKTKILLFQTKMSILLLEDDRDMRDLVIVFRTLWFDVQTAEDGIKGQALALQYSPTHYLRFNVTHC